MRFLIEILSQAVYLIVAITVCVLLVAIFVDFDGMVRWGVIVGCIVVLGGVFLVLPKSILDPGRSKRSEDD